MFKKTQISIFLIIGLVSVISLFALIHYMNGRSDSFGSFESRQSDYQVYDFIDQCLQDASEEGIDKVGIAYDDTLMLERFIEAKVSECIDEEVLESTTGFDLMLGSPSVSVEIPDMLPIDGNRVLIDLELDTLIDSPENRRSHFSHYDHFVNLEETFSLSDAASGQENMYVSPDMDFTITFRADVQARDSQGTPIDELTIQAISNVDAGIVGTIIYDIEPSSTFSSPFLLEFDYSGDDLSGFDEDDLAIVYLSNGIWRSIPSSIDKEKKKARAWTDHFTTYGLHGGCDPNQERRYYFDIGNTYNDMQGFSDTVKHGDIAKSSYDWYYITVNSPENERLCISDFGVDKFFMNDLYAFFFHDKAEYNVMSVAKNILEREPYMPNIIDEYDGAHGVQLYGYGECIDLGITDSPYRMHDPDQVSEDYYDMKKPINAIINNDMVLRAGKNRIFFWNGYDGYTNFCDETLYYGADLGFDRPILVNCLKIYGNPTLYADEHPGEEYPCYIVDPAEYDIVNKMLFRASGNFEIFVEGDDLPSGPSIKLEDVGDTAVYEYDGYIPPLELKDLYDDFYSINPSPEQTPYEYRLPLIISEEYVCGTDPRNYDEPFSWREFGCSYREYIPAGKPCNPRIDGTSIKKTGIVCIPYLQDYRKTPVYLTCTLDQYTGRYTWEVDFVITYPREESCDPTGTGDECDPIYDTSKQRVDSTIDGTDCVLETCINGWWVDEKKSDCKITGETCIDDWYCLSGNCNNGHCCETSQYYDDSDGLCMLCKDGMDECSEDYQCCSGTCADGMCTYEIKQCYYGQSDCTLPQICCKSDVSACGLPAYADGCTDDLDCCFGLTCNDGVCCDRESVWGACCPTGIYKDDNSCMLCTDYIGQECNLDQDCGSEICADNYCMDNGYGSKFCSSEGLGKACMYDAQCDIGMACCGIVGKCSMPERGDGCYSDQDCCNDMICDVSHCCRRFEVWDETKGSCVYNSIVYEFAEEIAAA